MAQRVFLRSSHLTCKLASWNRRPLSVSQCLRCMSSKKNHTMTDAEIKEFKENGSAFKQELKRDAGFLTKVFYRTCLRSLRVIRPGNEKDESEFQEREQKRIEQENSFSADDEDVRLGLFSMLPPGDREDELRSRAEYYHQQAREGVMQEANCLPLDQDAVGALTEQDVERFVFMLQKGEKERKWLLDDMSFPDPYQNRFPKEEIQQFKYKAIEYISKRNTAQRKEAGSSPFWDEEIEDDNVDDGDVEDIFDGDEDVPHWVKEKYPHLAPRQR